MRLPIIGAAILLSACVAQRTTIQSSWADTRYDGPPLDRVAVAATFETRTDSLAFERNAADYFATQGVATVPAHELLGPGATQKLDETELRERLAAEDVDGLLIFRLIAIDERRDYSLPAPSTPNAAPARTRGDAFSYHPSSGYYWLPSAPASVRESAASSSEYWAPQTFLVAETALFDNRNDRLLWTAKSETVDEDRFERTSASIVRSVARRLFAMDLVAHGADIAGSAQGERG